MEEKNIMFIYGTLRKGHQRENALKGQEFLGLGRTVKPYLFAYSPRTKFPAICEVPDIDHKTKVIGEVWKVDRKCLDLLDSIEGHPNFYTRFKIEIEMKDHMQKAWAYFLDLDTLIRIMDPLELIEHGDYTKYLANS